MVHIKKVQKSLLSWQRVRVANQMAKNGAEWGDYSMRYNSGTYNNQYMIIDTNLFTVGEPLKDNTLTVVEQMPNNVAVGDQLGVRNRCSRKIRLIGSALERCEHR